MEIEARGTTLDELLQYMGGNKVKSAFNNGDSTVSLIVSGQVAGLIDEIKPARKLIEDIISEAEMLVERLNNMKC